MRVHVLTPGFTSPNGCAFLFPLVVYRRTLAARGIAIRLFRSVTDGIGDCDALLVDSKFHRDRWAGDTGSVVAEFAELKRRAGRLLYFDTTDSTGRIQVEILPIVDRYCKNQLLRDRRLYLKSMYGARLYTDYYHREFAAADAQPSWSEPVLERFLGKLALSWNSGIADYSPAGRWRMAFYYRVPLRPLLRFPGALATPSSPRPVDISCRFGASYSRDSVTWQRKAVRDRLARRVPMERLNRSRYFRELAESKIVVSPFGFGEINYRDYETFLTGGLLLKPDMTHVETWPDFFRAGETMMTHRWDLSDLEDRIDEALADYGRFGAIAARGQANYLSQLGTKAAEEQFADRFRALVSLQPVAAN